MSTEQLQNMMATLEEQADFLTALALFSIKSVDKKIAFILGLVSHYSKLFLSPFDISLNFFNSHIYIRTFFADSFYLVFIIFL